ncbi:ribonuclease domain-containing protein [Deinococcus koreensis]|uniref:Ribonuclease n=1 Tax=Deinococcus koreensis TaxID=2054903 RepID=A0A2K3UU72_9DEIO|nr:ribonuclease domain-containing protein [Deinococcus koreensis]PNY80083.1 ribonuclease [Deinococcus koreensis]
MAVTLRLAFLPALALATGLLAACDVPAKPQSSQPQSSQPVAVQSQRASTAGASSQSPSSRDPDSGLRWMSASDLPREGRATLQAIARGGPFRYAKDGVTFGNRERVLPRQQRGYYREYTVPTPGEGDRGARRIVCGGQRATSTAECYYTSDHYATFRRLRP